MLFYQGYFPLQILAHAEEITDSPSVHSKIIYAVVFIPIKTHWIAISMLYMWRPH